jgi:WD40 repeat protein
VRALMLRLVGEGEGDAPVRRRAPLAELDLEGNDDVADVLATLVDSRLVTVSEGNAEVAHEALLREWPRLRDWIEDDTEGRRLRRHITQAATEWDAAGRDQGELYRGARLAAALDSTADRALDLNELEREFIAESREASEKATKRVRRTNRRLRGLLIGVAVLLAAAVAGGIFAAIQRSEARHAETGQLAQRLGAQALVEEDLDLSLLLARQAVAIHDSPQTRSYLLSELLRSPAAIGIMQGGGDDLREIAVSPDGKTLAVGGKGADGLRFFDVETYEQIGESVAVPIGPRGVKEVTSLAYSPDGETLAFTTGFDAQTPGYLRVIDVQTREVLAQEANWFPDVAFTQDGSLLILTEYFQYGVISITVKDATTLKQVGSRIQPGEFAGANVDLVYAAPFFALTPDGDSVVTASTDGELAWWDLERHEKTRALEIAGGYHAIALSPDGLTAAVGIDGGIQRIDVRSGKVRTNSGVLAGAPQWLVFSPDGKTVVSTGLDGIVTLWEAATATPRATLRGHSAPVRQPVFSPDGGTLYTASDDGTAIAWDVNGNRRLGRPFTFTHDPAYDPTSDQHPGRLSPNGRLIAVGLKRNGIRLWDATALAPAGPPLVETGGEVKALAFSPDGRTLAAVTSNGMASVWDVESRTLGQGPFPVGPSAVSLSFSADGTVLATAGGNGVKLWKVATGAALGRVGPASSADDVAFSPTGPIIAFVSSQGQGGGNAEIWDVDRRSRIATLQVNAGAPSYRSGRAYAVAFSPNGRMLAIAGDRPLVQLWDIESGKVIREFEQNVGGVRTLEFSSDGTTLALSGFDPVASLWNVATGRQLGPRLPAGSRETMLDLSAGGRQLLTTAGNGQGALWDVAPESWKHRACDLANRTLTREEWEKFLPGRPYQPACAT